MCEESVGGIYILEYIVFMLIKYLLVFMEREFNFLNNLSGYYVTLLIQIGITIFEIGIISKWYNQMV